MSFWTKMALSFCAEGKKWVFFAAEFSQKRWKKAWFTHYCTIFTHNIFFFERSRINSYRALASPSLIALSSKDPILTAFELSWELRRLSFAEHEFKSEYMVRQYLHSNINIQEAMESFAFPDRISSISTDNPLKSSKLCFSSLESLRARMNQKAKRVFTTI